MIFAGVIVPAKVNAVHNIVYGEQRPVFTLITLCTVTSVSVNE